MTVWREESHGSVIEAANLSPLELKSCCAAVYQSDWARLLLGDSYHPGGPTLTHRLGELLGLRPGQRVLDVAAGNGPSVLLLAQRFRCQVVGLEFGAAAVAEAARRAGAAGLAALVEFVQGDGEALPFSDGAFDALVCECSFCTFPDKPTAAAEFARVLRPGGRLGLADLTRNGDLPPELLGVMAWVACLADAQPVQSYVARFQAAGVAADRVESHSDALRAMVREVRGRLLGAEVLTKLGKLDLPGVEFDRVQALARSAAGAVEAGTLGYAVIIGTRQPG